MDLLLIYTTVCCGIWLLLFAGFAWSLKRVPLFHEETSDLPESLDQWPLLSIIIPACNEAGHIEAAMQSLLEQDYPKLEIVAINDRSIDATGQILDRIAETDSRLKVLHIDHLPEGWLGKVNALNQGVKQANGDWLLFCDADIYFTQGLLRRAILFVKKQHIDHLALFPKVTINSFWLGVNIVTFGLLFLLSARAGQVNRHDSRTPIGIGAFNLVSMDIFKQTPGFSWLRMEPVDDYGLGLMINNAGGRSHLAFAYQDLEVPWYHTVIDMFRGLEKNVYGAGSHYTWWRLLLSVAALWALVAAPIVALTAASITYSMPLLVSGIIPLIIHVIFLFGMHQESGARKLHALFFPVGIIMLGMMMLWSGYRCIKNGGIDWRGTHYTLDELRAGQRVKFK